MAPIDPTQELAVPDEQPTLSTAETLKDTTQVVVERGADHIGRIVSIIAAAVRDVAHEIGELATEGFDMLDASRKARGSKG